MKYSVQIMFVWCRSPSAYSTQRTLNTGGGHGYKTAVHVSHTRNANCKNYQHSPPSAIGPMQKTQKMNENQNTVIARRPHTQSRTTPRQKTTDECRRQHNKKKGEIRADVHAIHCPDYFGCGKHEGNRWYSHYLNTWSHLHIATFTLNFGEFYPRLSFPVG